MTFVARPIAAALAAAWPAGARTGAARIAASRVIAVGAVIVGGLGWAWTGLFTLAVVRQHPAAPGRAVGAMMSGLFVGAIAGPLLVGAFARHGAYAPGWLACAAPALGSAAIVTAARGLVVRRRRSSPLTGVL